MTNEEKILDILALMQGEIQKMSVKVDNIDNRVTQADMKTENEVLPKMNALFEGQATIKDMLTPRSKIDELEDRVKFLESLVRQMNEKFEALGKAQ